MVVVVMRVTVILKRVSEVIPDRFTLTFTFHNYASLLFSFASCGCETGSGGCGHFSLYLCLSLSAFRGSHTRQHAGKPHT